MTSIFKQLYVDVINKKIGPASFAPEELLYYVMRESFHYSNEFVLLHIDEVLDFCIVTEKKSFIELVRTLTKNEEYALIVAYAETAEGFDFAFSQCRYFLPCHHYQFQRGEVIDEFKKFYSDRNNADKTFNSIDICPDLGCIIGINGSKETSEDDFKRALDNELKHYGEKIGIKPVEKRLKENEEIIRELTKFYGLSIIKGSFTADLETYLFNEAKMKELCDAVKCIIEEYNSCNLKQFTPAQFSDVIWKKDLYSIKDEALQEAMLFCWVCSNISGSRWRLILNTVASACEKRRNVFVRIYKSIRRLI